MTHLPLLNTLTTLSTVALALLILGDAAAILRSGGTRKPILSIARAALAALLLGVLVARSAAISFWAVFDQHGSLLFFAATILIVAAALESRTVPTIGRVVALVSSVTALALLGIASSPLVESTPGPVLPALRSFWLPLHIGLAFVGEALFTVAFAGSIVWLLRAARGAAQTEPRQVALDQLVYRSIAVGYALFTVGALLFGAIWAQRAWGRYWGWDPKETWAFVTWLVYSLYLHVRYIRGGRGRVGHWLSVLGYAATMFTLFGVNILYRSLHAY